ncbi:hypothetical protein [Pseudonocardia humida]|uniref:Uncharacterized protein n=1 Tax=Pseudonocardia humida TaxID=2800819 RepID=A0ABT1A9H7_9PSEU|nr:hypothetical protein [Pseudonocardia humida]MCO1659679.1 hypothetical protein [Pseudonocardia humida]
MNTNTREVTGVPHWLYAVVSVLADGFHAMTVYSSLLLRETDEMYRPVREFLAAHCNTLGSVERAEDPDMMFGGADLLVYSIWEDCPGPLVVHACKCELFEVAT